VSQPSNRLNDLFFELFEPLPRQGPGNRACAERALALCRDLPAAPAVIDLGCGAGGQTLYLAELTRGPIVAVDGHAPNIDRLRRRLAEQGLGERVVAKVGDMADPGLGERAFDLVWSEGALYNLGLEAGLAVCRRLLRPGGYLVFTEPVWLKPEPPAEVAEAFADYAAMGTVADALAAAQAAGFAVEGHFTLPNAAWWDDFYGPMELGLAHLCDKYADDDEALALIGELAREPAMHRRHGDYYGYELIVARLLG
jgi:SAM-dependent methyltransferase